MSEYVIVMSTTDSEEEARSLARGAVEARLAACVQSTVVSSTFWWDEKLDEAKEFLLLFKTTRERASELKEYIEGVHSYDTPEIIEVPIVGGGAGYLNWISDSTR